MYCPVVLLYLFFVDPPPMRTSLMDAPKGERRKFAAGLNSSALEVGRSGMTITPSAANIPDKLERGQLNLKISRDTQFHIYRAGGHLVDLGFLPRYCFVCPILLGQVGIRQVGQMEWWKGWKHPNLSQQRIVYEVIGHPVQS